MTSAEVTIRRAEPADAERLAEIHREARRAAMPPGIHSDQQVVEWLKRLVDSDEVWVADVGGVGAAYARIAEGWLDDLYVDPAYAGQGLGSALLDLAKARLPDGFGLWVFEMNEPARAFYAHRGLVEVERTDGSGNEEQEPDIRMEWRP